MNTSLPFNSRRVAVKAITGSAIRSDVIVSAVTVAGWPAVNIPFALQSGLPDSLSTGSTTASFACTDVPFHFPTRWARSRLAPFQYLRMRLYTFDIGFPLLFVATTVFSISAFD